MMKSNTILSKIPIFLTVIYEKEKEGHKGKELKTSMFFLQFSPKVFDIIFSFLLLIIS